MNVRPPFAAGALDQIKITVIIVIILARLALHLDTIFVPAETQAAAAATNQSRKPTTMETNKQAGVGVETRQQGGLKGWRLKNGE